MNANRGNLFKIGDNSEEEGKRIKVMEERWHNLGGELFAT